MVLCKKTKCKKIEFAELNKSRTKVQGND